MLFPNRNRVVANFEALQHFFRPSGPSLRPFTLPLTSTQTHLMSILAGSLLDRLSVVTSGRSSSLHIGNSRAQLPGTTAESHCRRHSPRDPPLQPGARGLKGRPQQSRRAAKRGDCKSSRTARSANGRRADEREWKDGALAAGDPFTQGGINLRPALDRKSDLLRKKGRK